MIATFTSWLWQRLWKTPSHRCAHLCRESSELPVGTGLSAAGVDLTREQGWCPVGVGDVMVSEVSESAPPPPSKNTSLAPVNPGDITKEGRVGVTTPEKLEDEPLPRATGSVTWETGIWLSDGWGTFVAALSLSPCSSAAFWSIFPSLSWHWGRPSSEILLRNNRAACLLRESFVFLRCSLCVFSDLLLRPVAGRPQTAVAILV